MIRELLGKFGQKRILVLGDIILDHYVWGKVERISQEAPVPVIEAQKEEWRLGGAANVALNIHDLGAKVDLIGIVGSDASADTLRQLLLNKGISTEGVISDPGRSTTLKTRIGADNQQIVRIDYESKADISSSLETTVLEQLEKRLPSCSALLIEDYNKGLLTQGLIAAAIASAEKHGVPVAVDPKQKHFFCYRGVDIFKPNFKEMQTNLGLAFEDEAAFVKASESLRADMGIKYLVVTRGSQGLYIFAGEKEPRHLPTYAKEVFDVSGAGDTVISAMTLAYACGSGIDLAAQIANHAAGVVCGIKGTASVSPADILQSYNEQS